MSQTAVHLTESTAPQRGDVINKCVICGKKTDAKGSSALYGKSEGRKRVEDASTKLQDGLISNLSADEKDSFRYHTKTCYANYCRRATRVENDAAKEVQASGTTAEDITGELSQARRTRLSAGTISSVSSPKQKKVCIICNAIRLGKQHAPLYRIGEQNRAQMFLAAYTFNMDEVWERCVLYSSFGDIFAADLHSHGNCMNSYIKTFRRRLESVNDLVSGCTEGISSEVEQTVSKYCSELALNTQGYDLSACRDEINALLSYEADHIDNRQLKNYLKCRFGESICFTYPKDKSRSQMFFSSHLKSSVLAETIRSKNASSEVAKCAELLRSELKGFSFGLSESYCDSTDLFLSMEKFRANRPEGWANFCKGLLGNRNVTAENQLVCDTIFQIAYHLICDVYTPFGIGFAEALHNTSRSKHMITLGNKLGVLPSYKTIERIDNSLATRIIDSASHHRVPVASAISPNGVIHAAADNFDKNDGKEGSHDTILMLFQNGSYSERFDTPLYPTISVLKDERRKQKLDTILECQKLIPSNRTKKVRGSIPEDFAVVEDFQQEVSSSLLDTWTLARYVLCSKEVQSTIIPSLSAVNSILIDKDILCTSMAHTPILPYPATCFDSINTVLLNYQDVLIQMGRRCGAFWCDEGVYHIAKELQLLFPAQFNNIFIGLGGFHMEKNILGCIGEYLNDIGARDIFVQNEIFTPSATDNKVMNGGDYVLSRSGMRILCESISRLRFDEYFKQASLPKNVEQCALEINSLLQDGLDEQVFRSKWKLLAASSEILTDEFRKWVSQKSSESQRFKYWSLFIDGIMPVIQDLTLSFRNGDWNMHLSAVRRALNLFFAFGHTNYCRWAPVYFEECKALPQKFPELHEAFLRGDFVVYHTSRKGSAVPIDQALEKAYNKPAKGPGGIIGFTRRKESVAKWNLIQHEKANYTKFIDDLCDNTDRGQYALHHEFSAAQTKEDEEKVKAVYDYLRDMKEIFSNEKLCNIFTGTEISDERVKFLLEVESHGDSLYSEYQNQRLVQKTKHLFDTISKPLLAKKKSTEGATIDTNKEQLKLVRSVDIARARGFDLKELFMYELTETSLFLSHPDGRIRTPKAKSELLKEIRVTIDMKKNPKMLNSAVIIDFMAHARKVTGKKNKLQIRTFGDWVEYLSNSFLAIHEPAERIDIVFDLYLKSSRKDSERRGRAKTSGIYTNIRSMDQPLPSEMDKFWACSDNKIGFQHFFINWLKTTYSGSKSIYLGGAQDKDEHFECYLLKDKAIVKVGALKCTHEEADQRLQFHISHAVNDFKFNIIVSSGDTDVFVNLMYNFPAWRRRGLSEILVEHNGQLSSIAESVEAVSEDMVMLLPAVHTLTGCDVTSKVGTKKKAIKAASNPKYHDCLFHFGQQEIDDEMLNTLEAFLVDCLPANNDGVATFDEVRYIQYHNNKLLELHKFPCTSQSLKHHLKRSYLEAYTMKYAATSSDNILDETLFGYQRNEEDQLIPIIVESEYPKTPPNFPHPCQCGKCARQTVCLCRKADIICCVFCKCKGVCRNPLNV